MTLSDVANSWLAAHNDDLVGWRRHIHRYPELGRQEYATTQFVAERLVEAGLNPKVLPGGTGLTCDFGPDREPRIALRADIDALPMAERTGAAYASTMPNAAHACGHDAHTAILLGAALALAGAPELPVGLRLVFQPAEELMPGGAIDAIAAGALSGVSRIFALHCDPRLAVGKIAVKLGPITSAADAEVSAPVGSCGREAAATEATVPGAISSANATSASAAPLCAASTCTSQPAGTRSLGMFG